MLFLLQSYIFFPSYSPHKMVRLTLITILHISYHLIHCFSFFFPPVNSSIIHSINRGLKKGKQTTFLLLLSLKPCGLDGRHYILLKPSVVTVLIITGHLSFEFGTVSMKSLFSSYILFPLIC